MNFNGRINQVILDIHSLFLVIIKIDGDFMNNIKIENGLEKKVNFNFEVDTNYIIQRYYFICTLNRRCIGIKLLKCLKEISSMTSSSIHITLKYSPCKYTVICLGCNEGQIDGMNSCLHI